jgi:hypothetical protein
VCTENLYPHIMVTMAINSSIVLALSLRLYSKRPSATRQQSCKWRRILTKVVIESAISSLQESCAPRARRNSSIHSFVAIAAAIVLPAASLFSAYSAPCAIGLRK